jgi:16S rRNA G527 N7-methylase RsmG
MKGVLPPTVSRQLQEGWSVEGVHKLEVPGLDAERHVLLLRNRRINHRFPGPDEAE